ncbi:ABC transporter permease [Lignipirellula cremea]|uniref:ABC-2 family transporter protein n=1 Tax=Lignipirellula cremea TaxID=2528010 RepID=A0A518DLP0_9BACT|nr:hypothetical protein [Lignipirellula cremea]QDU92756.1 hypothetical protein Pla8534_05050 [Lignipirellula cremea]
MSTLDKGLLPEELAGQEPAAAGIARLEGWLDRAGERLNPILVKEARQAMKSMQFVVTFTLLILCAWAWTGLVLSLSYAQHGEAMYFQPMGPLVLAGYFTVLAVPLLVIVPYMAFRSLASEREDGTFELLSITALSARQIVTGKLGSAILQIIVYYSALSPCIAFTYLLRGIDVVSIMLLLSGLFLGSVLLSALGLLLATVTTVQVWQMLISILQLIGQLFITGWVVTAVWVWVEAGSPTAYDDRIFWLIMLLLALIMGSFLALFVMAAAAQISFSSDNRSTRLRMVMCVQHLILFGWAVCWYANQKEWEAFTFFFSISAFYWAVMGSLMSGEMAELSPRVRRQLPQSLLGRAVFTWFNPGSGTGTLFALLNYLLGVVCVAFLGTFLGLWNESDPFPFEHIVLPGILWLSYLAIYLTIGRGLVMLFRQRMAIGVFRAFSINLFVIVGGAVGPFLASAILPAIFDLNVASYEYDMMQLPNWLWTIIEVHDESLSAQSVIVGLVLLGGGLAFLVQLALAAREVEATRQAAPQRVLEDEAEMHPRRESLPSSPWDHDEPASGEPAPSEQAAISPEDPAAPGIIE